MSQVLSRTQRRAAFTEAAVQMFERLEDWYDQHPDATFGEIEAEARRQDGPGFGYSDQWS